jgi:hypothetical protein
MEWLFWITWIVTWVTVMAIWGNRPQGVPDSVKSYWDFIAVSGGLSFLCSVMGVGIVAACGGVR